MEEFLLVDDDFCGNCSNSLISTNLTSHNNSPKIYNLDIVVHTVKENQSLSVDCEKVSVFTAIKDLLSCQFQTSETDSPADELNHNDNFNLNSTNKINEHGGNVNVQVPLCLPCSLLLQDLYRSFKLFQSLRDGTSYISKLTRRIQQTFPISDVRHINDADYHHGIQFGEYGNNESEVQTIEDQFGDEINVKVNPSPSAAQSIVNADPMENVILNPRNVQISALISNDIPSATETNIKTEPEMETTSGNGFGLTVEMQEKMIHSAISQIAAEEVGPSRLIECEGNSRVNPSMPATRITSDFDPAPSATLADAQFERGNTKNENNYYKLIIRRSRRFRSKLKSKSKQRPSLKVVSTSRSSYSSEIESAILTIPEPDNEAQEEDGNDSDEIQVVYEASSHQSNSETGPEKEITIINAYSVEVPNPQNPKAKTKMYKCHFCNFATSKPHVFSNHKRNDCVHSPTTATTTNSDHTIKRRGKNTNPNHLITQPKEKVKCSYCSFRSVRKTIVVHERLHTGEKPFACPLAGAGCSFRAAHSTNVNKHMKTHLEDNQFPCSLCPYRGKALKQLKCHQNMHHPELLLLPQFK